MKRYLITLLVLLCAVLFSSTAFAAEEDHSSFAYLSDQFPNIETEGLRVFHNEWDKPRWDPENAKQLKEGPMKSASAAYTKAIAMFMESHSFVTSVNGAEASGMVWYRLDSRYDQFIFDLDVDATDRKFCGSDDGQAAIQIFADDVLVYESDFIDYTAHLEDQTICVSGVDKLQIVLTEKYGGNNTLHVLLGNPRLIQGGIETTSADPQLTSEGPGLFAWLRKIFG